MSDHDFNTPPWLLGLVRQLSPIRRIGLDPCSNSTSMVDAVTSYTVVENGLIHAWRSHGLVFVNPPHSMSPFNIEPWMEKARTEFLLYTGGLQPPPLNHDQLVMLVPAKTDTDWFHSHACHFHIRCFLKGRPKFWHRGVPTPGPGKFASMVIYHGARIDTFISIFDSLGWLA